MDIATPSALPNTGATTPTDTPPPQTAEAIEAAPAAAAAARPLPPLTLSKELAVIGVLFVGIYWSTFGFMMYRWIHDPAAQHGWLVIPISAYVAWRKREKLLDIPRSSHAGGAWVIGFALLLHLFEKAVDLNGPSPLSIPLFVAGAVWYFAGTAWLRELSFPIAYLLFMIPIPGGFTEIVSFPLRLLATEGAKKIATFFGVYIQSAGMNIVFLPPYRTEAPIILEIADPCSGLHSLMALKALHGITAYLTRLKLGWKWVLFMCAIPIALAANLTRIVGIILLSAYISRDLGLKLWHDYSSPLLFAIAFAILISIGRLMEWATRAHKNPVQNTLW